MSRRFRREFHCVSTVKVHNRKHTVSFTVMRRRTLPLRSPKQLTTSEVVVQRSASRKKDPGCVGPDGKNRPTPCRFFWENLIGASPAAPRCHLPNSPRQNSEYAGAKLFLFPTPGRPRLSGFALL